MSTATDCSKPNPQGEPCAKDARGESRPKALVEKDWHLRLTESAEGLPGYSD